MKLSPRGEHGYAAAGAGARDGPLHTHHSARD